MHGGRVHRPQRTLGGGGVSISTQLMSEEEGSTLDCSAGPLSYRISEARLLVGVFQLLLEGDSCSRDVTWGRRIKISLMCSNT